ncbi:hypothetical protein GCM10009802_13420 [Streptomyces synnematoformans]|uniref:Uncharacterized protein n=1 Tax=Streptomyces synnematoformans TaxID=415721 RepID=A0ABN2XP50_9ACTN
MQNEIDGQFSTQDQRAGILRLVSARDGDYARRGLEVAESIAQQATTERRNIRAKTQDLRGEGPVITDMSHDMFCNLAAGGILADLVVCPETLGVGCAAALAVYLLADSRGC